MIGPGEPVTAAQFQEATGIKPEYRDAGGFGWWMADAGGEHPANIASRKLRNKGYRALPVMTLVAAVAAG